MGLPYQCLASLGQGTLLCAAKGPSIVTFDIATGPQTLTSWSHPSLKLVDTCDARIQSEENGDATAQGNAQPPSKKRKVEAEAAVGTAPQTADQSDVPASEAPADGQKPKKQKQKAPPKVDVPFVILLAATESGSHIVAVTGQDKTLWVFEHDGKGALEELSQRTMPKRPCSMSITSDPQAIICADKFGDVYAVPLIPSSTTSLESGTSLPVAPPKPERAAPKGANSFTVHTERNLKALEDQQKHRKRDLPKEGPTFEHHLLLGHVSMLTAVVSTTLGGRPYIITGDRDEHIRVSRGMPQAHVIETYCLGHAAFISALCVPRSEPGLLISGGGDNELFLWDWKAGKLLAKTDVLGLVNQELDAANQVNRMAVSRLYAYDTAQGCYVIVLCERIPNAFIFKLENSSLTHAQTISFPRDENPLDIALTPSTAADGPMRIITTLDSSASLFVREFRLDGAHSNGEYFTLHVEENIELPLEELQRMLYPIENLRKTEREEDVDVGNAEE
ncbi:hypothetical protein F5Y15DRAFT_364988 [Xylariaceae sp. FL0016]|nr:hypothetical protein F5Y15DRAFT_364988 [Xylariaceae sp. FL0016]